MLRELIRIPLPFTDHELPIYGYGMMVLVGFLAGTWVFQRGARRHGWDSTTIGDMSMWMVLMGLVGGRVFYYVQFYDQDFRGEGWFSIFKIWEGGLVLYGGIIAGLATFFWIALRSQKPLLPLMDAMGPALAVGIGFGRLGCLFNGCCWGKVCSPDFLLGLSFPEGSPPALALAGLGGVNGGSVYIHPTQIYASLNAFLMAGVLWFLNRARPTEGVTTSAFLVLYGSSRFLLESIRGDHDRDTGAWTT
ncbi:MAG: prolipoprotein diacylglyceryl transferase, partial [Planctomycetota bacterium]